MGRHSKSFRLMLTTLSSQEAFEAWKTPLFAPHFHQTGFLHCASEAAPEKAIGTLNRFRNAAEKDSEISKYVVPLDSREDILRQVWQYKDGSLPGWKGYLNRFDGYGHSSNALIAVHGACAAQGVRMLLGAKGDVAEVVYDAPPQAQSVKQPQRRARGVRTRDGQLHEADLVIVAAGAGAGRLIPDLGTQVVAKSWSVAHIQLTDDEAAALRGIPVTYCRDLGFFFEPEYGTNLLKLCPMGGGFVNTDSRTGVSHPPATMEECGFMPRADQERCRKLLAQTLPAYADRPLINQTLCWFADTADSDFIIDYVPNTSASVLLLSGDSGHGFKMFPIFGKWVKALLEVPEAEQSVARWRWKTPKSTEGGDWGGDVSWRLGSSEEYESIRPSAQAKL